MCETVGESLHLAYGSLDDGIEASLWGISVPGHHLLLHFLREAAHLLRQGQNVFVAKLWQAGGVNAVNEAENIKSSLELLFDSSFISTSVYVIVKNVWPP